MYSTDKKPDRQQALQQPCNSPLHFISVSERGQEKLVRKGEGTQLRYAAALRAVRASLRAYCYITQQHSMAAPVLLRLIWTLKHKMLQLMTHI